METKKCTLCKEVKNIEDFHVRDKSKNTRKSRCKKCTGEYHYNLYRESEKRRNNIKTRSNEFIEYHKNFVKRYKSLVGCQICKQVKKFYMLDLHHTDNNKEANISLMVSNASLKRIKEEMRKCIVVCANCHRELHWLEKNE